jgi:hypothetical protein
LRFGRPLRLYWAMRTTRNAALFGKNYSRANRKKSKNEEELHGIAHYHTGLTGRLVAVMEYIGIARGITKVTTDGGQPLPPGAEY